MQWKYLCLCVFHIIYSFIKIFLWIVLLGQIVWHFFNLIKYISKLLFKRVEQIKFPLLVYIVKNMLVRIMDFYLKYLLMYHVKNNTLFLLVFLVVSETIKCWFSNCLCSCVNCLFISFVYSLGVSIFVSNFMSIHVCCKYFLSLLFSLIF